MRRHIPGKNEIEDQHVRFNINRGAIIWSTDCYEDWNSMLTDTADIETEIRLTIDLLAT